MPRTTEEILKENARDAWVVAAAAFKAARTAKYVADDALADANAADDALKKAKQGSLFSTQPKKES